MKNIEFRGDHFGPDIDIEHGMVVLRVLLNALYLICCDQLERDPSLPDIFRAGVRYKREPRGREHWQDYVETLRRGNGDCEDLACAVAAYITVRFGIEARPDFTLRDIMQPDGTTTKMFHIFVRLPGGKRIDPSRILGMGVNDG